MFDQNPGYLSTSYLSHEDFSTQGKWGGGILAHYDSDNFNAKIQEISESDMSDQEKVRLVKQERERILKVLTMNLIKQEKDSSPVPVTLQKVTEVFMSRRAREHRQEEREFRQRRVAERNKEARLEAV